MTKTSDAVAKYAKEGLLSLFFVICNPRLLDFQLELVDFTRKYGNIY